MKYFIVFTEFTVCGGENQVNIIHSIVSNMIKSSFSIRKQN